MVGPLSLRGRRRAAPPPPTSRVTRSARRNLEQQTKSVCSTGHFISSLAACIFLCLVWGLWFLTRQPAQLLPSPSSEVVFNVTATSSVYDRGLVNPVDVSYQSVLKNHRHYWRNTSHRHFQGSVLAYVTPWNGKGYDMARLFRSKFTHVSPVWYQLKRDKHGSSLHGQHDVDRQWIADVRQGGCPKIVPRVVLEGYPTDILVNEEEREKAIDLIISEVKKMEYDGVVLEGWSLWRGYRVLENPTLRQKALEFVKLLGMELHTAKTSKRKSGASLQFIFVIPPPTANPSDPGSFTTSDLIYLRDSVDGFSLMTYDYSNAYAPGPNAPLSWIRKCLQVLLPQGQGQRSGGAGSQKSQGSVSRSKDPDLSRKTWMGLNFYGNDYVIPQGGGAIIGHDFISLLAQLKPVLTWDGLSHEHYISYSTEDANHRKTNHKVFYPSLESIAVRLREAESCGLGISIWEIGQGLDYFFDLL